MSKPEDLEAMEQGQLDQRDNAGWQTSDPPKDGAVIVAIGRVIVTDPNFTSVEPFCDSIRWEKDDSGYEGWHYSINGITVAQSLDDEVIIDFWIHHPNAASNVKQL